MKEQWAGFTDWLSRIRPRWVPIGILAVALFAINAAARLVTWKAGLAGDTQEPQQLRIGYIAVGAVAALMLGAAAWWSMRHPLGRMVADLGAATLIAATLSALVGPFAGGSKPFREGLAFFVGQFLLFGLIALAAGTLGYAAVVAFGKDYKTKSLKRYVQNYKARPRRALRG